MEGESGRQRWRYIIYERWDLERQRRRGRYREGDRDRVRDGVRNRYRNRERDKDRDRYGQVYLENHRTAFGGASADFYYL